MLTLELPGDRSRLASAKALNELLHRYFPEEAVFRIDHFLGKQTVQNILGVRFANPLFQPAWNREHVVGVNIVWDETVALEGRAGYYDGTGALRDMIQNHLLQLLCLVAMEKPHALDEKHLRDRKVELLRTVRRPTPAEVAAQSIRARYAAGAIGERHLPDYTEEDGVDPALQTETFAEVTLFVDNDRWQGVPFRLRPARRWPTTAGRSRSGSGRRKTPCSDTKATPRSTWPDPLKSVHP